MEFQLSYFKSKRWCCESAPLNMPENLENSAVATGLEKVSFHSNPKAGNTKECSNYCTIAFFLHASKLMLKSIKQVFNSMWTVNLWMFKLDLGKVEEPEIKLPTSTGSYTSERVPEKHVLLLYWLCQGLWQCGSQQTVENSSRDGKCQTTWLPPEKSVCKSRSNS